MAFTKPDEIYRFEKARRALRVGMKRLGESDILQLSSEFETNGLGVLISGGRRVASSHGQTLSTRPYALYGTTFTAINLNLSSRSQTEVEWKQVDGTAAAA